MPTILKSPEARADLLEIGDYIFEQSHSAETALRVLDSIDEKIQFLSRNTLAAEARPDLAPQLRCSPVGNYVIFYRPIDDGIEVVRVLHGARDIPALFRRTRR
jgi:toxin ParE1/3/4